MKTTYFDLEWANSRNRSICQIGIICEDWVDDRKETVEECIFVNPDDGFEPVCVAVHGITEGRVSGEKTFPEVWNRIQPYFTDALIVGHNVASADLRALERNLSRYGLVFPSCMFVDTLEVARHLIPDCCVPDYKLKTLCDFMGIPTERSHDALSDARASRALFKEFLYMEEFHLEDYIHEFRFNAYEDFISYVSAPAVRKAVTDFYGIVRGIAADSVINDEERKYLESWEKEHSPAMSNPDLWQLVEYSKTAVSDGILTGDEKNEIDRIVGEYYEKINHSPETLAVQVLEGILKGTAADGQVNDAELKELRTWLYENSYLEGNFPYDRILSLVEDVLADGVITEDESRRLMKEIESLLDPVAQLQSEIHTLSGSRVCLSGNFTHGSKSDVAAYIVSRGGTVEDSVKKTTDILVVGDCGSVAYTNGNFGTKVKKAIALNSKGASITIMKESDLYSIDR